MKKNYAIPLGRINDIEKKLGIFAKRSEVNSEFIMKLRSLLAAEQDLDNIWVIVRKMASVISESGELSKRIEKEDAIRFFVEEAGFEEKQGVCEFLGKKNLAEAVRDEIVTQKMLAKELKKVESQISKLGKILLGTMNKKISSVSRNFERNVPAPVRLVSNYLINPLMITSTVMGSLAVVVFAIGRYAVGPIGCFSLSLEKVILSTQIPAICGMLDAQKVFLAGFAAIFFGGFIKMMDEKIREKIARKSISV